MNDEKIIDIFKNFDPQLSSDTLFLSKLQRNMNAVEVLKKHNSAMRRQYRIAILLAGLSGILTGIILTLLYPMINDWILSFDLPAADINILGMDRTVVAWIVMTLASCLISFNVYELAISRMKSREMAFGIPENR